MSIRDRFWSKVQKTPTCWLWIGGRSKAGYGAFRGPGGKQTTAHRIAYWLECGDIQAGKVVCHRCDNPACVRPSHLFLGTQSDNIRDMIRKGRTGKTGRSQLGERNNSAKVGLGAVKEIRKRHGNGERQVDLAKEFGITKANVWAIVNYISWKHV